MSTADVSKLFGGTYWTTTWESWSRRPQVVKQPVSLVKQTSDWSKSFTFAETVMKEQYRDCGLACVLMALKHEGDGHLTLEALAEMCPSESIWTIDLAYLMKRLNMRFVLVTKTIGADPDFMALPYYSDEMLKDQERVNALFRHATTEDIPILHQSLHICHLRQMCLSACCLIILLVNSRKLRMLRDDVCWMLYCLNIDVGFGDGFGYEGHYILLSGYDERTKKFHVHDPSGSCYWVLESIVDAARVSYGTDEDMIIVYAK